MRSNSDVVGGEADPELDSSFVSDGLEHGVNNSSVGEDSIDGFHLLELGLGIVEG